jgi:hypothetical protein
VNRQGSNFAQIQLPAGMRAASCNENGRRLRGLYANRMAAVSHQFLDIRGFGKCGDSKTDHECRSYEEF